MTNWTPKPGEPGYWVGKLRDAKTEPEFLEAYLEHKKEIEKHPGAQLRPYSVLCNRLLGRFGQYGMGGEDDERREDAIFVLKEIQRYLVLSGIGSSGINASSAVRKRTIAEIEADMACAAASVLGFERSRAEFEGAFPAESATPTGRKLATVVDLECTGEDDHDPAPCPKCERVRERIGKAVDVAMAERDQLENQSRNAGVVFTFGGVPFGAKTSQEDLEKSAKDGIRRGAKAELELRKRKKEREEASLRERQHQGGPDVNETDQIDGLIDGLIAKIEKSSETRQKAVTANIQHNERRLTNFLKSASDIVPRIAEVVRAHAPWFTSAADPGFIPLVCGGTGTPDFPIGLRLDTGGLQLRSGGANIDVSPRDAAMWLISFESHECSLPQDLDACFASYLKMVLASVTAAAERQEQLAKGA